MTTRTWMHRLEEWSHPPPPSAMATAGLVILSLAIVLLALGGVALSQDPVTFDLWVLAIGLFLLAGAVIGIGRSKERGGRVDRPRSFSDHASLAEAPALSAATPSDPAFSARRGIPAARPRSASDTIAGQYAEASRLRSGRLVAHRPAGDPDPYLGSGYPYSMEANRRAAPEAGGAGRASLEAEVERLRARVAELEATRGGRIGAAALRPSREWPGPSLCVGCGTVLVGGPDDARCPRCGRPMCANCAAAVRDGPLAHQCPECRGALPEGAPTPPVPAASIGPMRSGPAAGAGVASRPLGTQSP